MCKPIQKPIKPTLNTKYKLKKHTHTHTHTQDWCKTHKQI
jgi:hypothetical protein